MACSVNFTSTFRASASGVSASVTVSAAFLVRSAASRAASLVFSFVLSQASEVFCPRVSSFSCSSAQTTTSEMVAASNMVTNVFIVLKIAPRRHFACKGSSACPSGAGHNRGGESHVFDSFECAIHALAPRCPHCQCRVIGHGVEQEGQIFCCVHCARAGGRTELKDRA